MSRVATNARIWGRNKFGPFENQQGAKSHGGEQQRHGVGRHSQGPW